MYRGVCTVGVAVTRTSLTLADVSSYVIVSSDAPYIARCLTGLGPNSTHNGANSLLGGLYFNGTMIPNSGESASCGSSDIVKVRPDTDTAGVINIHRCEALGSDEEGIYTCTMMNSSMMEQSVRFHIYLNGRSESLDLYIPLLNHLSSLYTAAPVIDTPSSSTVTVNVGSHLTLNCTSRGSPPDTFTWRKDNGPVLQSTTTPVTYNALSAVFRANYSIDNVTTVNSGTYTCTVTNPIGSNSATIRVVVNSKLII